MRESWKYISLRAGLLLLLTVVTYLPALRGGFIWDDDDHLTANAAMTAPGGLRQIWSSLPVSRYYPLTLTTFWVERRLWGLLPLPYHAVNILLHAISAALLLLLLRRLNVPGACLAAAIWAVHPVNVESVAWITELKNTQSGLFFFLALLFWLRYREQSKAAWYGWALFCYGAALLSKPSTVILPGMFLLLAWWRRERWSRTDFLRLVPFVALAAGMSALTVIEQHGHIVRSGGTDWSLTIPQRVAVTGFDLWFYAGKLFWPVPLSFVYPRWEIDTGRFVSFVPVLGVLAVLMALWKFRRRPGARACLWGIGYFIIALLPVLGLLDIFYFRYSFVADHFQYLAGIGLMALAAAGITTAVRSSVVRGGLGTALVLSLCALSWRHCGAFQTSETLWRDTIAANPGGWMAHYNLGATLVASGRMEEGMAQYERALQANPQYAEAHNNLGTALMASGRAEEGMAQYKQALQINPRFGGAHYNLGLALVASGKTNEGMAQYEQALHANPYYAEAHNNLGAALVASGRIKEGMAQYEQALQANPQYAEAHNNLGLVLVQSGEINEGIAQYEQALQANPDDVKAHNNLGLTLVQSGRFQEAITHLQEALRLRPNDAETHYNLGLALAQSGRFQEAITHFQEAVRLRPNYAGAYNNLGGALVQSGRIEEGMAQYERALQIDPHFAQAHNNLGTALVHSGKIEEGIAQFEQALQANPRYAKAHYNLGLALVQSGRLQDAITHFQEALRLRPDYPEAHAALEQARGQLNNSPNRTQP